MFNSMKTGIIQENFQFAQSFSCCVRDGKVIFAHMDLITKEICSIETTSLPRIRDADPRILKTKILTIEKHEESIYKKET